MPQLDLNFEFGGQTGTETEVSVQEENEPLTERKRFIAPQCEGDYEYRISSISMISHIR